MTATGADLSIDLATGEPIARPARFAESLAPAIAE